MLPDLLPPGSRRLGSAFLRSRLPPSASAVVATPEHCTPVSPRVLSTQEVAWLFQQPCVHDPRCGARTSCLGAASSLAACCLLWACSSQVNVLPGQTVQRRRELLLHRSHGFFRHRRPGVSGTKCLPNDSTRSVPKPSKNNYNEKKILNLKFLICKKKNNVDQKKKKSKMKKK